MYMDRMLGISKAANGYVVECHVPIKPEKKKESKDMIDSYPGSCEKQYIAKDMDDVFAIVKKVMPMLDMDYKSEDEFDAAFDKAAGEGSKKHKMEEYK